MPPLIRWQTWKWPMNEQGGSSLWIAHELVVCNHARCLGHYLSPASHQASCQVKTNLAALHRHPLESFSTTAAAESPEKLSLASLCRQALKFSDSPSRRRNLLTGAFSQILLHSRCHPHYSGSNIYIPASGPDFPRFCCPCSFSELSMCLWAIR